MIAILDIVKRFVQIGQMVGDKPNTKLLQISYLVLATDDDDSKTDVETEETFISKIKSVS